MGRERDRDRERQRQGKRERASEREIQTDRQTDRQRQRDAGRQANGQRNMCVGVGVGGSLLLQRSKRLKTEGGKRRQKRHTMPYSHLEHAEHTGRTPAERSRSKPLSSWLFLSNAERQKGKKENQTCTAHSGSTSKSTREAEEDKKNMKIILYYKIIKI